MSNSDRKHAAPGAATGWDRAVAAAFHAREIESQIEKLFIALGEHHFGATFRDKPFCSCGWFGKPSINVLSAERQFSRHLATALVNHHGVLIR